MDGGARADQDVLRALGEREDGPLLVGFAATRRRHRARPRKLTYKRVNPVVFNDVSREDIAFDSEENEVTFSSGGTANELVQKAPKRAVAGAILDEVARLLEEADGRGR